MKPYNMCTFRYIYMQYMVYVCTQYIHTKSVSSLVRASGARVGDGSEFPTPKTQLFVYAQIHSYTLYRVYSMFLHSTYIQSSMFVSIIRKWGRELGTEVNSPPLNEALVVCVRLETLLGYTYTYTIQVLQGIHMYAHTCKGQQYLSVFIYIQTGLEITTPH